MKPKRIVSLCPSNTEILFALGLVESIVGVDSHSDYPTQVKELPRVGTDLRINMEKVKALEPDLVVASLTVPGMERNIEALEKTNSIVEDSDILSLDPDILLICWCGEKMQNRMSIDKILTRPGWENIKAIKEKWASCVPESLFGRPGPRIIDGLKLLSQIVHRSTEAHERPEIFGRFGI